jgi:hypothetical protein
MGRIVGAPDINREDFQWKSSYASIPYKDLPLTNGVVGYKGILNSKLLFDFIHVF